MGLVRSLGGLMLAAALAGGCGLSRSEGVDDAAAELVDFPAAAFASPVVLPGYGVTSAPIATSRTTWGIVAFDGRAGDEIITVIHSVTEGKGPRSYLVEKREDGAFVSIFTGSWGLPSGGLDPTISYVRTKLARTQRYYLAFRENDREDASFTATVDLESALPPVCDGDPLLDKQIAERTPQGETPSVTIEGRIQTLVRRCNAAAGCGDIAAFVVPDRKITFTRGEGGHWSTTGVLSLDHDRATGKLRGTKMMTTADVVHVPVDLTGVATTGCVAVWGKATAPVDDTTYDHVEMRFIGLTPPPSPRTSVPTEPPSPSCEGATTLADEELLGHFWPGTGYLPLGSGTVEEASQVCDPDTGCKPWSVTGLSAFPSIAAELRATSASTLAVSFRTSSQTFPSAPIDDGVVTVHHDLFGRGEVALTGSISPTSLVVKETKVFTRGNSRQRRHACFSLPPPP
jgi:hypothetical protein